MTDKNLNRYTPIIDPNIPPTSNTNPITKSTFLRLKYVKNPVREEPTIWFASLPTATAGEIPPSIKIGVVRKPPPTPNIPDKMPAAKPIAKR